jgi:2-hydroxychromene-2-carboxylate isomerase
MPKVFPANGLTAARIALCGEDYGWLPAFSRAVYEAQFEQDADIADTGTMEAILRSLGLDASAIVAQAASAAIKDRLRQQSDRAQALGIFGAPAFVTADGELFWGDDRLEQALAWARND